MPILRHSLRTEGRASLRASLNSVDCADAQERRERQRNSPTRLRKFACVQAVAPVHKILVVGPLGRGYVPAQPLFRRLHEWHAQLVLDAWRRPDTPLLRGCRRYPDHSQSLRSWRAEPCGAAWRVHLRSAVTTRRWSCPTLLRSALIPRLARIPPHWLHRRVSSAAAERRTTARSAGAADGGALCRSGRSGRDTTRTAAAGAASDDIRSRVLKLLDRSAWSGCTCGCAVSGRGGGPAAGLQPTSQILREGRTRRVPGLSSAQPTIALSARKSPN